MKIIILGTGSAQKDIIEYCKNRSFYVIACSNVAGYSSEKLVNEFHQIDIVDADSVKKLAIDSEVDFIYTIGSDVAMPTIAKVSREIGLPCFVDYETAVMCNNKDMLRDKVRSTGKYSRVSHQVLRSSDDKVIVPFPAMIKPSDSQGQRGVRKVENIDDVRRYFSETVSFSRSKKVIIEPYIEGDEISVNVFLENGELRFYLMSDREAWTEYPGGIIKGHRIPSKYEANTIVAERIRTLVIETLEAIGLRNGPGYFQIKIDDEGYPFLIEVTPRLDGCHMWRLIKYSTGVDLLDASVEMLQGGGYNQAREYKVIPYSLEFFCGKPGTRFSQSNYSITEQEFLRWYYQEGDTVNHVNGYFEKCGYVITKG